MNEQFSPQFSSAPPETSPGGGMGRRRFLETTGLAAAALLFSRREQLFAAENGQEACNYALNPVASILHSYSPPQGRIALDRPAALEFDIIGWNKLAGKKEMTVEELRIGVFHVARKLEEGRVTYEISRRLDEDFCEGKILCRAGKIETVESWETQWSRPSPMNADWKAFGEKGSVKDGRILLQGSGGERTLPCSGALVADASLFFNPGLLESLSREGNGFVRLDQTMAPRSKQRARLAGSVDSSWGTSPLQAWLISGRGSVPSHFVHDDGNRPLFFTGLLTSSTLKSIS